MKKIVLAVCLMFGGAAFVNAQERDQSTTQDQTQDQPTTTQDQPTTPGQSQYNSEDQEQGQQIAVSELPEQVTASLESQDYAGWTVGNAYKKTDEASNKEMYVVELKRGTETKKVKFDSEGNKIDKKDKNKSDDQR